MVIEGRAKCPPISLCLWKGHRGTVEALDSASSICAEREIIPCIWYTSSDISRTTSRNAPLL